MEAAEGEVVEVIGANLKRAMTSLAQRMSNDIVRLARYVRQKSSLLGEMKCQVWKVCTDALPLLKEGGERTSAVAAHLFAR